MALANDVRILNQRRSTVLGEHIARADKLWSRFLGLLGRSGLHEGEGLHIVPCGSVHMLFMRMALDIVYLDAALRVVKTVPNLRPWRFSAARGAKTAIELPAGTIARTSTRVGDQLAIMQAEPSAGNG